MKCFLMKVDDDQVALFVKTGRQRLFVRQFHRWMMNKSGKCVGSYTRFCLASVKRFFGLKSMKYGEVYEIVPQLKKVQLSEDGEVL